jgi:hypothetical protein
MRYLMTSPAGLVFQVDVEGGVDQLHHRAGVAGDAAQGQILPVVTPRRRLGAAQHIGHHPMGRLVPGQAGGHIVTQGLAQAEGLGQAAPQAVHQVGVGRVGQGDHQLPAGVPAGKGVPAQGRVEGQHRKIRHQGQQLGMGDGRHARGYGAHWMLSATWKMGR